MAQLRQVFDQRSGQFVWVDSQGRVVKRVNPGLGSLPGQAEARERDLMSRLPDAQLAGYSGPTVTNPTSMRGARPNDPDPVPPHTYRPLAGAKQNNRGGSRIVPIPLGSGTVEVGSIVETSRQAGDDAEAMIVTCQATMPPTLAGALARQIGIVGNIEFGIGGSFFDAEFDWPLGGVAFGIAASFARVGCQINHSTAAAHDPGVAVSASLAYGPGPQLNGSTLRKTLYLGTIAAGATSTGFIPNFASTVAVVHNTASPNFELTFTGAADPLDATGVASAVATYLVNDRSNGANQQDQFPIPGWAYQYALFNNTLAAQTVSLVFGLAL